MVVQLRDGIKLYHGSYTEVKNPNLLKCAKYKDFGQGFYLTTNKDQAENFAKISLRKALNNEIITRKQNYGVVSTFIYHQNPELQIKIYPEADLSWLKCIVAHRKLVSFPDIVTQLENMDIIGGKIANDNTNATINAFITGTFGDIESERAQTTCIELLLPERLQDQYCFRTAKAINCLEFIESEQV